MTTATQEPAVCEMAPAPFPLLKEVGAGVELVPELEPEPEPELELVLELEPEVGVEIMMTEPDDPKLVDRGIALVTVFVPDPDLPNTVSEPECIEDYCKDSRDSAD